MTSTSDSGQEPGRRLEIIPGEGRGERRRRGPRPASSTYRVPDPPPEPSELYDPRDPANEPVPPGTDHWSFEALLESEDYSKQDFYPQSSHDGDASTQVRVTVSASVYHLMQVIVQQRRFPQITTMQDLIRDAIHHRLHDYELMLNRPSDSPEAVEMRQALSQAAFISQLDRQRSMRKNAQALYEALVEEVAHYQRLGDDSRMRQLVLRSIPHVNHMDVEYRDQARALIQPHADRLGIEI